MDNGKIYTSTVRLYKNRQEHKQAYEYLMQRDKEVFKSKDDFIAEAIIHFSQHLQQDQDKVKVQEAKAFLEDKENPVFDTIRNILSEVIDEKISEIYKEIAVSAGSTEESKERAKECTDLDKRFAQFYDYD